MDFNERRSGQRRPMKTKALLAVEGGAPMQVRTVDISTNGLGISAQEPLRAGVPVSVKFELYVDGHGHTIIARGLIAYSLFSGGEFKAGVTFSQLDLTAMTLISKYIK